MLTHTIGLVTYDRTSRLPISLALTLPIEIEQEYHIILDWMSYITDVHLASFPTHNRVWCTQFAQRAWPILIHSVCGPDGPTGPPKALGTGALSISSSNVCDWHVLLDVSVPWTAFKLASLWSELWRWRSVTCITVCTCSWAPVGGCSSDVRAASCVVGRWLAAMQCPCREAFWRVAACAALFRPW